MSLPADIANQALDAAGFDFTIGDLQEGTKPAQVLLRAYSQCLRQLLRAVHWNWARKQAPLTLLADATGQTAGVSSNAIAPWVYEYALPDDCMKARFVPWGPQCSASAAPAGNSTPSNASSPLMGGLNAVAAGAALRPARFLEAMDPNFPPDPGQMFWTVQGVSPQGRTVILTNVQNASLVYTALMNYPSNWDAQFRAAFVAFLAAETAFALWSSKGQAKFGMQVRDQQMKIAAAKIMQARMTDGNEGWSNADFTPDWMRFRNAGGSMRSDNGWGGGAFGGPGIFYGGCDACCGVAGTGNTGAY